MKCPKCGMESDENYCANCGTKLIHEEKELNNENSSTSEHMYTKKKPMRRAKIIVLLIAFVLILTIVFIHHENEKNLTSKGKQSEDTRLSSLKNITVEYKGPKTAGTKIEAPSEDFIVKAHYGDLTSKIITQYSISEPIILAAGETSTVTIEYKNQTVSIEIKCITPTIDDYKQNAVNVGYEDLLRNPGDYEGTDIMFKAQIMQVMEAEIYDLNVQYLVKVTQGEYGFWEDIVYVDYTRKEGESRLLEDDIITIYGVYKGLYSYETVNGASNTVPLISADYMILN